MESNQRCMYQSSRCPNEQAIKPNGERHRLCAYHRDRANETQRLWHSRHKHYRRRRNHPYKRRSVTHLMALASTVEVQDEIDDNRLQEEGTTTPRRGDASAAFPSRIHHDELSSVVLDEDETHLDRLLMLVVEHALATTIEPNERWRDSSSLPTHVQSKRPNNDQ